MKNEKSYFGRLGRLTDLLLLLVNSIGIVGALVQVLEIPWAVVSEEADAQGSIVTAESMGNGVSAAPIPGMEQVLFWAGLFLICISVILLQSEKGRKWTLRRSGICVALYLFLALIFKARLMAGLSLALQNVVRNLNGKYLFHIALPVDTALLSGTQSGVLMTVSVLFIFYPLELLAGLLWNRGRNACLLLGNILWLSAAFICDVFPDYFYLTFCVLGIVGALVQKEFEEMPGTGLLAAACILVLTGLCVGMVRVCVLPVMDERYEAMQEGREEFYRLVNEEWIPQLQSALPGGGYGFGGGPDVTGELNRRNLFSYTSSNVYSVTVDSVPQGVLYLKGFVGASYGEEEWEAWPDRQLESYYGEHGLELPEDYSALVNISYMAAEVMSGNQEAGHIGIRELGGKGSYSIYPYGALLTEEFKVYGDGSVARRGKEYGFQYHVPEGFGGWNGLPEEWAVLEGNYRQYVYDNFLEYPREELPLLTQHLEQERFSKDSVYLCLLEVMAFLSHNASYNLDVGRNPSGTDFVEYFLFDSHKGYCVHFATAAVLTLRYLGIPARYATGYVVSPSDFSSDDGNTYTAVVTGRQAHAWAEIYLDAIGWVPVEMTPGAVALGEDNRLEQAASVGMLAEENVLAAQNELAQMEQEWQPQEEEPKSDGLERPEDSETLNHPEKPLEETSAPSSENMPEKLIDHGEEQAAVYSVAESTGGQKGNSYGYVLKAFLAAAAAVILPFGIWGIRKGKKNRWQRMLEQAGTREEIFLRYRQLRMVLSAAGCSRRLPVDGKGFRHFIRRNCPQITQEEYETFCGILAKNSFADKEPSAEELQEMRLLHERILKEAYGKMPFYKRVFVMNG